MKGRNIQINGQLIRNLRNSRGWTQKELASKSGYTDRLIRKAELGGSLDLQTAVDLADALSIDWRIISVTNLDIDGSLIEIAKQIVQGPLLQGAYYIDEIEPFLCPEFVLRVSGDLSRSLFAGTWSGLLGLKSFLEAFHKTVRRDTDQLCVTYTKGECLVSARYIESFLVNEQRIDPFWVNLHFHFSGASVLAIDVEYDTLSVSRACRERHMALSRFATDALKGQATKSTGG